MPYLNPEKRKEYHRNYYKKYYSENKEKYWNPEYQKSYRQKWRMLVIQKYGSKCKRCGFSDIRALQIDHVNGGGHNELRRKQKTGKHTYYKIVFEDTTGKYQLLCANCNWIKRVENNEMNMSGI